MHDAVPPHLSDLTAQLAAVDAAAQGSTLPPLSAERTLRLHWHARETPVRITQDTVVAAWTLEGDVPGPTSTAASATPWSSRSRTTSPCRTRWTSTPRSSTPGSPSAR